MRKIKTLVISLLLTLVGMQAYAQSYTVSKGGYTTEITFYSPDIIRVTKYLSTDALAKTDPKYVVTMAPQDVDFTLTSGSLDTLRTSKVTIVCSRTAGTLTFYRSDGTQLLKESGRPTFTKRTSHTADQYNVAQAFKLDKNEAIYGFGQVQDGRLNHRGANYNHMVQSNMSVWMPYFQSVKGYGLYWDLYGPCNFSDNSTSTTFTTEGAHAVDYYVLVGSAEQGDDVVQRVRQLTGQATMVPLWTFGYFQSKERYTSSMETLGVLQKYRSLKVPIDCVVQDWQYWGDNAHWNAMEFLNPNFSSDYQKMIDGIHQAGGHLMISFWANFGPETQQYAYFKAHNQLMLNGNEVMTNTYPGGAGVAIYSPYQQTARDYYWQKLNAGLVSKGVDAYWVDSSEPDHYEGGESWEKTNDFIVLQKGDDASQTYNPSSTEAKHTWRSVRNVFPLEHARGVYEGHRAQGSAMTDAKRVMIMTRSGFLGMQRYGAGTWSGDVTASWETLSKQVTAAVNYSACGVPSWNSDIGGFFNGSYRGAGQDIYDELYARWIQFGAFCTIMRSHGSAADRAIYQFGTEGTTFYDNIARYINLRYALLPYIYSTARRVHADGYSFLRAMPMAYQTDAATYELKDQFMFGRDLLVAPVLQEKAEKRSVYLPKGDDWTDFWTGEQHKGGQTIDKLVSLTVMPLYVRQGSIVPWGPNVQYSEQYDWQTLEIRVYPGADGQFVLYEDERDNYNYEKGNYSEIPFAWNEESQTLTIGNRQGSFAGMQEHRKFNIVLVSREKGLGLGPLQSGRFSKVVEYDGQEMSVKVDNDNLMGETHAELTALKASSARITLFPGQAQQTKFTATFADGSTRLVTIDVVGESDHPEVAYLRDGVVYACQQEGEAQITATYTDVMGNAQSVVLRVTVKVPTNIYKWRASEWAKNRVADRVGSSDIKYSSTANTITITKTGAQNIALRYLESKYILPFTKYFCVVASDVSDNKSDSQLWYFNGSWKGTTNPSEVVKLKDGRILIVWPYDEVKAYTLTLETVFGLTSTNSQGKSTISYIGFEQSYTDLAKSLNDIYTAMQGVEAEPDSDATSSSTGTAVYNLQGTMLTQPQKGVNIVKTRQDKTRKVLVK